MSQHSDSNTLTLTTLFERFVNVEKPQGKSSCTKYRLAIRWFRMSLNGREPTTADLTTESIASLWKFCGDRGLSRSTIGRHRTVLGMLWRYASRRGLVANAENLPPVVGRFVERSTPRAICAKGSLQDYYENTFRPERVAKLGYPVQTEYDASVRQFGFYSGGNIPLDQVTAAKLDDFRRWLVESSIKSELIAHRYTLHVAAVVRHAEPSRFPKPSVWNKPPDVDAPEGSILRFFQTVYAVEKELASGTQGCHRYAIARYRGFLKREPMLTDFSADPFNRFLTAAQERHAPATVKGYRRALLALWRSAFERGDVSEEPKRIRRIKAPPPIPDAFTPDELGRLVAATYALPQADVGAILRAVIFAIYDSGFRISDVRALRRESIDWITGVVTIRMQKTQLPITRQFRPATLDALRAVRRDDCELAIKLPWGRETLWSNFRRLLQTAGLPGGRRNSFQKLRRTSATFFALVNGAAEATTHLGHSDVNLARRHYLDPKQAYPPPPLPPPIPLPSKPVALLPAPDAGRGAA